MNKLILISFCALFCACSKPKGELRVAASSVPHAQILEAIKPDLKAQGITLTILVTDDYNMPNRALAQNEVDANFFQHRPFLDEQVAQFHYPIESLAKVEIEPMGIYSAKISSLDHLKNGALIALPNDPTNEGRALFLLKKAGLLELNTRSLSATPLNISKNFKNLKFIEIDAAMLPRTLQDVDAAAVNTNYALEAQLSPESALILEGADSPYVNILAIRTGDADRADLLALKAALTSEKVEHFLKEQYHGAVLPASSISSPLK